jgi:hypothetical protein
MSPWYYYRNFFLGTRAGLISDYGSSQGMFRRLMAFYAKDLLAQKRYKLDVCNWQ